ncbi:MAG TPA: U32 family peptidase [Candidatus Mcinerneyibacteriales bacterium]|nr:U32 family peptidase [Candidatus Mcinerneyibacteriales bacterium]
MSRVKRSKLLAPAGTFSQGAAALAAGADALYAGLPGFNARRMIDTGLSSMEEYLGLLDYARERKAEFHCAVNILIKDHEVGKVMKAVSAVAKAGADVFIVQDYGLLLLLLKEFPGLTIHTSTQFAVDGSYGFSFLKKLGVKGVILPREADFDTIAGWRSTFPDLHLEAFVHGALCYSISGQCYFSAFIGGRSGNRGLCGQPCRRIYSRQGEKGHLFSCKDLSLYGEMDRILSLGLDYLKIEGRAKGEEYTAAIVRFYKEITENDSAGRQDDLDYIFNRGYTTGGMFQDPDILNPDYINHRGRPVGRIEGRRGEEQKIRLSAAVSSGDGVTLPRSGSGGLLSTGGGSGATIPLPPGISGCEGEQVWKNSDARLKSEFKWPREPGEDPPRRNFSYARKRNYRFPVKKDGTESLLYALAPPGITAVETASPRLCLITTLDSSGTGMHRKVAPSFRPEPDTCPPGEVFWVESWDHYAFFLSLGKECVPWWTMNIFNSLSAASFSRFVFSPEMEVQEILKNGSRSRGIVFCDGPIPLMRTRYPMITGEYRDERGHLFEGDASASPALLYNEKRLLAVDYLPALWNKTGGALYDGSRDPPQVFRERVSLYLGLIEKVEQGGSAREEKEALKKMAPYTTGLYGEGVI